MPAYQQLGFTLLYSPYTPYGRLYNMDFNTDYTYQSEKKFETVLKSSLMLQIVQPYLFWIKKISHLQNQMICQVGFFYWLLFWTTVWKLLCLLLPQLRRWKMTRFQIRAKWWSYKMGFLRTRMKNWDQSTVPSRGNQMLF